MSAISNTPDGLLRQASLGSSATTNASGGEESASTVVKKKRNLPGNPDPDAEVVALSPGTLMATNRYMCEVCHKGFQRDQNLQLHRRGHNLPWKLKQRSGAPVKRRVYICPEVGCPHHEPSRALGDLTGIKKHFCRKHGEKKWKCDKCSKRYAVQSDWKAHAKICGTREYRCDCGTIFSRRDSFITHRAFCDALAEENYKVQQGLPSNGGMIQNQEVLLPPNAIPTSSASSNTSTVMNLSVNTSQNMTSTPHQLIRSSFMNPPTGVVVFPGSLDLPLDSLSSQNSSLHRSGTDSSSTLISSLSGPKNTHMAVGSAFMSATALLQKAAEMGAMVSDNSISPVLLKGFAGYSTSTARSCGSVQEACHDPSDASSQILIPATVHHHEGIYSTMKSSQMGSVLHNELLDSTHMLNEGNPNNMGGGYVGGIQKGFYGSERTTADFLSLGPVGDQTARTDATEGFGYAAEQENLHDMSSYGTHTLSGRSPLEKPMWNF